MTENELRSKVVKTAQSYLGCKESDGSHRKIIDIYNTYKPHPRGYKLSYSDPWCAGTMSAVAIECGLTDIMPVECSCTRMIELYKKIGRWVEADGYVPDPGDLVMYDWNDSGRGENTGIPEHVGMVVSVVGNIIKVIEGNYSNAVKYRNVEVNGRYIRGYCCPDYTKKATTAESKPAEVPMKSIEDVAKDVIAGKYGTGTTRKAKLAAEGYDPVAVQNKVNELLGAKKPAQVVDNTPKYTVNNEYKTQVDQLSIRVGAGTGYARKTYAQLSADARKHAYSTGHLKKGTIVTCLETKKVGNDVWMRIPSGWCAAYYGGEYYIK